MVTSSENTFHELKRIDVVFGVLLCEFNLINLEYPIMCVSTTLFVFLPIRRSNKCSTPPVISIQQQQ